MFVPKGTAIQHGGGGHQVFHARIPEEVSVIFGGGIGDDDLAFKVIRHIAGDVMAVTGNHRCIFQMPTQTWAFVSFDHRQSDRPN